MEKRKNIVRLTREETKEWDDPKTTPQRAAKICSRALREATRLAVRDGADYWVETADGFPVDWVTGFLVVVRP